MKRILAPAVVVAISAWAYAAQPQSPSPEQEVQQISEKMIQSAKQPNVEAYFESFAADAFLIDGVHYGAQIATKAEAKKNVLSGLRQGARFEGELVRNARVIEIKVQGDSAASVTRVWRSDGDKVNNTSNIILTFARRDGDWKIISFIQHAN